MERQNWAEITLPGRVAKCYCQKDTVFAICHTGQVVAWSWGGAAVELPIDHETLNAMPMGPVRSFREMPGVLFHPVDPGIIFLVWMYVDNSAEHIRRELGKLTTMPTVEGTCFGSILLIGN